MFHRMMNYGETETKPTVALTKEAVRKILPKFKRHDDLILVQEQAWENFKKLVPLAVNGAEANLNSIDEDELASVVCQSIQKPTCRRLAIEQRVKSDDYRSPRVSLLLGSSGIVRHKENHILYQFDVTKCMFSFGNITEKLRMASLDCSQEVVVDLFAGIGYFTLPLLIHAKAKHLYACEWNPDAVDALRKNLLLNKIKPESCTVIEGDNRLNRPADVAQRVLLGILPSCLDYLKTALQCVDKSTGAILHCHDLVETKPEPDQLDASRDSNQNSNANNSNTVTNPFFTASNNNHTHTDRQSSLNQSFTSDSNSSHSTIEKLSVPLEDLKMISSEQERRDYSGDSTNSASIQDASSSNSENGKSAGSGSNDQISSNSMHIVEPQHDLDKSSDNDDEHKSPRETGGDETETLQITDCDTLNAFQARAKVLLDYMGEDLENFHLTASLNKITPVKSYAPHITHVVFDIKLEPRPASGSD